MEVDAIEVIKKAKKLYVIVLIFSILATYLQTTTFANGTDEKAVVFLLDSSGSMTGNDPNRLAIDSIAQLIYSLPSDYIVGVVAYNNEVVLQTEMVSPEDRPDLIKQAEAVTYQGYTNAGTGLKVAMDLIESTIATEKDIVILSDGEILMGNAEYTKKSVEIFQAEEQRAVEQDVAIHVIGLGDEMEDTDTTIFSSATKSKGSKYHVPKATDIQKAIDSILLNELHIKKNTLAVVESDGSLQNITVSLPSKKMSTARILLTSTDPITSLVADFNAISSTQSTGLRYAVIELINPTEQDINLTLQSEQGSQIKVDFIPEYDLSIETLVSYEDIVPENEDAEYFERTAIIELSFVDSTNKNVKVLTDKYFENIPLLVTIDDKIMELPIKNGTVTWNTPVTQNQDIKVMVDFTKLPVNILGKMDAVNVALVSPELLPQKDYYTPYIIGGIVVFLGALIVWITYQERKKVIALAAPEVPESSKFHYVGKLNLYITKTKTGIDIPPLSFSLFRLSSGRAISLKEVLDDLKISEVFEGSEKIFFKPSANRSIILNNQSDCTIMKSREILMKNKSYQLELESKVDITFEDETSELMLQYKDIDSKQTY